MPRTRRVNKKDQMIEEHKEVLTSSESDGGHNSDNFDEADCESDFED